ncbi:MADS-box protein AGL42-like [Vigna unguiculata]|uniref:MADS-box protein AGL42-like n=1 Tax=Vigna unguiculata TaxID=3917 RepID=UPI0010164AEF|nr:MADS-box protein AGL42-like [Vigna unguiculata]
MAPPSAANDGTTSNSGRRREIEIKEVEQRNRRCVTFSKRKLGLFNKLTELSLLCRVETAYIITSQNGNVYSCGYPTTAAVLHRYVTGRVYQQCRVTSEHEHEEFLEKQRLEYENVQNKLKEKQKQLKELKEAQNISSCFGCRWNLSHENMGLEDLEEFKCSLESLKLNLITVLQEKEASLRSDSLYKL